MKIEEIIQKVDANLLTEENKSKIVDAFEVAVDKKTNGLMQEHSDLKESYDSALERIEALEEREREDFERIEQLHTTQEKYEELLKLYEEVKGEYRQLKESNDEQLFEDMTDKVDGYLKRVVDDFIAEREEFFAQREADAKVTYMAEALSDIITKAGIDTLKLVNESNEQIAESNKAQADKLSKKNDTINQLFEEVEELSAERDRLLQMGVMKEVSEGLTLTEAQRFEKLAKHVQFNKSAEYITQLEEIAESVKTTYSEDAQAAPVASKKSLTESRSTYEQKVRTERQKLNENTTTASWAHMV